MTPTIDKARPHPVRMGDTKAQLREILSETGLSAPQEASWLFDRLLDAREVRS